jgi:hypothetical protein
MQTGDLIKRYRCDQTGAEVMAALIALRAAEPKLSAQQVFDRVMPLFAHTDPDFGTGFYVDGPPIDLLNEAFPITEPVFSGGKKLSDLPEHDAGEVMEWAHEARLSEMFDRYELWTDL